MANDEKTEFNKLVRQRVSIKGRLTKFKEHVDAFKSEKELSLVQIRELNLWLEKCQSLFSSFDNVQTDIENICEDVEIQIKERDLVESKFVNVISEMQGLIESNKPKADFDTCSDSKGSSSSGHGKINNNIKLPTINLPTFDGNYLNWLEFRDTFDSLINSNDAIPTVNKFHYLRSSLMGSALVIIKSLEFSSKNYSIAWDLLCERYNNKNILINNHFKALFSIEQLSRESYKSLRFVIDTVSKNLRSLNSLGLPADSWDALIIYIVSSKLDTVTNCKWEEHKGNLSSLPTLEEFFQFLRNRAAILETTLGSKYESNKAVNNQKGSLNKGNYTKSFSVSVDERQGDDCSTVSNKQPCPICSQDHLVYL